MELGLLLLRVVVGALFVGHGLQKLLGWFDGPGRTGTAGFFGSLGYRKPATMAVLAGATETIAGLLLAAGFLTPLAAAGIIGVMLNAAVSFHAPNGLWIDAGGYEYNIVLAAVAAMVAFAGPGVWSIDAALGLDLAGLAWGVTAILLGLVVGSGVLATRSTAPAEEAGAAEAEPEEARRAA